MKSTDILEIETLMSRYTMCGDRGDLAGLASCFLADGTLVFPGTEAIGREEIVAALSRGTPHTDLRRVRHHLTSSQILAEPDGSHARARTYFQVITNQGLDHSGTYVDSFVRHAEQWLISRREVRIDWQSVDSLFRRMI